MKLFSKKQKKQSETSPQLETMQQSEIKTQSEAKIQSGTKEQINVVTDNTNKTPNISLNFERNFTLSDSSAEKIVQEYLEKIINTEAYSIETKKTILETFKGIKLENIKAMYENYCDLVAKTEMKHKHPELGHFDFVICSKVQDIPVLLIEVDGKQHATNPEQVHFDLFKQFITTHMFERPYIRLKLYQSKTNEDLIETLRRELQLSELTLACNRPVFCKKCGRKMFYRDTKDKVGFYYCTSCLNKNNKNLTRDASDVHPLFLDY